jgi:H+/Cl- antiporter ClcA
MINKHFTEQIAIFFSVSKWIILSSVVGIIIGAIVTFFLKILEQAENSREMLPFHYYYLLPFALIITVYIVKKFAPNAEGHGTEKVIEAVHKKSGKIDIAVIPVKLFATVVTIFAGGSVGKEGPGAQIGAGVSSFLATKLHFSEADRKKLVICGISAGFATVFGTPIAGAIFGVEVLIIGVILYDVLLPSFIAGFAAFTTAQLMGIKYTYFDLHFYQDVTLDLSLIFQVVIAGLFFGVISDLVVTSVSYISKLIKKIPLHPLIIAFLGGVLLIILALIFGTQYLGLGMGTIKDVLGPFPLMADSVPWYAFLAKTVFTSITLGVGGSGGIITPLFYIGATSGHLFGQMIGGDHVAMFAALGFVSVLSGSTNTPIAATIMAVELFGINIAHYAALSAVISFLITGHRSVYSSQLLAMTKSSMLNMKFGDEIDKTDVLLDDREIGRIKDMKTRLDMRRQRMKEKKNPKK